MLKKINICLPNMKLSNRKVDFNTYFTNIHKKKEITIRRKPWEHVNFDSFESLKVNIYFVISDKLDAEWKKEKSLMKI